MYHLAFGLLASLRFFFSSISVLSFLETMFARAGSAKETRATTAVDDGKVEADDLLLRERLDFGVLPLSTRQPGEVVHDLVEGLG